MLHHRRLIVSLPLLSVAFFCSFAAVCNDNDTPETLDPLLMGTWHDVANNQTVMFHSDFRTFTQEGEYEQYTFTNGGGGTADSFTDGTSTWEGPTGTGDGQINDGEVFTRSSGSRNPDSFTFSANGTHVETQEGDNATEYFNTTKHWSLGTGNPRILQTWAVQSGVAGGDADTLNVTMDPLVDWSYAITGTGPWTLTIADGFDLTSSTGRTLTSGSPWTATGGGNTYVLTFSDGVMTFTTTNAEEGEYREALYTNHGSYISLGFREIGMSYTVSQTLLMTWNVGTHADHWEYWSISGQTLTLGGETYTTTTDSPSGLVDGSPWTPSGIGSPIHFSAYGTYTEGGATGYWRSATDTPMNRLYRDIPCSFNRQ